MSNILDRIAETVDAGCGELTTFPGGDARSDNRRRTVVVSRDRVTIDRSYRGIAMRLSVPVSAYRGVCVAVRSGEQGGFVYELKLAHRDPDLSVTLAEACDDREIWADWRASAGFFNLPALVERNDGPESWVSTHPAGIAVRHERRGKRRRRPGIVSRRAVRPEATRTVHREHEIIARD